MKIERKYVGWRSQG